MSARSRSGWCPSAPSSQRSRPGWNAGGRARSCSIRSWWRPRATSFLPPTRSTCSSVRSSRARVVTPNLPEAAALLDAPIARNETEMREQGERLLALGPRAVLVKGGHGSGAESVDLLIEPDAFVRLAADRIATQNTHGTGCTLSSAIAAGLAKGLGLTEAVGAAKTYVTQALAAANRIKIGSGHGPTHHFHAWW